VILLTLFWSVPIACQTARSSETAYGPVMRAYLGYLRNEQEVVDDRVSKREITRAYFRRNSSRIRALRQMAIRIVQETGNDYIPELEAVTRDEMRNIFETPPAIGSLELDHVVNNTFRFLGVERTGELFYVFERLDPYEQAELMQKAKDERNSTPSSDAMPRTNTSASRPRRAISRN
jgi:hypothetical protein